jgi:ABC-type branched-subunit amino acid transport system ATPase component
MLLQLEGLTVRFGGVEALSAVDLSLAPGRSLGLMGPNGCGKTTLFNAISGVVRPDGGRVLFRGHDITGAAVHAIARRGIARTFQTVRLFAQMTVRDNVRPAAAQGSPAEEGRIVERALEEAGLAARRDVLAGELSLGEQRRLEIARALARSPHLVLMDEPTAGLNPEETDALVELVADAVRPAAGLILIEHKPDVIAALCPMAMLLDRGRATAAAPPAELFASDTFRRAYLGVIDREGGARPCG